MKLGIDLKIDYAFKWSFGAQERIGSLKSLLEHTLRDRLRGPIQDLTILNPIQDKENVDGKLSVLDILARDRSGKLFHIEMQMLGYTDLPQRFLYYTARNYWSQLKEGEEYAKLAPVISIFILNDIMFPDLPGFHHCFQMREEQHGQVFCKDIEIHLIELPKFEKTLSDLVDGFDQWLYLLCHSEDLDPQFPPKELTIPEIIQTLKALDIMSHTELERLQYEAREKATRDEISRRNWSLRQWDEGRQKGLQEGLQKERDASRRKLQIVEQINARKAELGQRPSPMLELFDLPEEELVRLLSSLQKSAN